MVEQRTMCQGDALCDRVMCCVVGCFVWSGRAVYSCVMVVYCVLGRCTVCQCDALYGRAVYCVVGRFTVCCGGVLCANAVYCEVWRCIVL